MLRRIIAATLCLALGCGVAAGLLLYAGTVGGARTFYAVSQDLPAGAPITADVLTEVHAGVDPGQAALLFGGGDRGLLLGSRARHQLSSGQLLQRSDVEPQPANGADALVAVPIKDLPPVRPGDRVDLFALTGNGDQVVAQPFAWAVSVAALSPDGLVLQVRGRQELAFVYAAGTMRLAAVVTGAPAPPVEVAPIGSGEAALAAAAG
ncbi:MAG TPA: hypothetical protein VNG93_09745 [Candidatus Dormibacteraeota bacterium]|nr:hypothetical protein [Candidatus Dormibacteraeota bacterium]